MKTVAESKRVEKQASIGAKIFQRSEHSGGLSVALIAEDRSLRFGSTTAENIDIATHVTWNFIKKVNRSENIQHQNG